MFYKQLVYFTSPNIFTTNLGDRHSIITFDEEWIKAQSEQELIESLAQFANKHCVWFDDNIYYRLARKLRPEINWAAILITESYATEDDYNYGCPMFSARMIDIGAWRVDQEG